MPPVLAIVGASVRAAVQSARRAGFETIAADLFADQDLCHVCSTTRIADYPAQLDHWLSGVDVDGWLYTGALENQPQLVDRMAARRRLLGNCGDVLSEVRSPRQLHVALTSAGLRFPETRSSAHGLPRDGTWLRKTYRGSSGVGVDLWHTDHASDTPQHGPWFQKRLEGMSLSATYVAHSGRAQMLGIARQLVGQSWTGGGSFQFCGAICPWPLAPAVATEIERVGHALAAHFGLVGLFGVDLIVTDDQVWTLEVNPRYTASVEVVERARGELAIAHHANACGLAPRCAAPEQLPPARCAGKAILFADQPVVITAEFAQWALAEAMQRPWPAAADIPAAGTHVAARNPICTYLADGNTAEEVWEQLQAGLDTCRSRCYLPQ